MLTEKNYCDYETCVALKELGYDELCEGYFHLTDDEDYNLHSFELCCGHDFQNSLNRWRVGAPMLYEAQKWLREEKKIDVFVRAGYLGKNRVRHYFVEVFTSKDVITLDNDREDYDSYEEALSEGVKCAVKILKEK